VNAWTQSEINALMAKRINVLMAERDDAIRERDEAQQMVAEMLDALSCWCPCGCKHPSCGFCEDDERVAKLLQKVLDQP